ncbi:hypothetical protein ACIGXF_37085 [Streptomyces sp. NPDC053086]|uniref:hypothetical protein n=1 Tax=Streptomyces sp. NPDC053086 TaxID=3365698 RepID=UPI0037D1F5D3
MDTHGSSFRRRLLIESLTVMAAPASDQTTWLEKHGVVTDEIALDFEHAFRMAERLVEEGLLGRDSLPDLRVIDSIFDGMTRNETTNRWTTAALGSDPGWSAVRELARTVLAREGVDASVLPDIRVVR